MRLTSRPVELSSRATSLFLLLTLAGMLGFAILPGVRSKLGLNFYDLWFVDTYAVLAASDASAVGLDPVKENSLDVLARPHIYSDWWLDLHRFGVTREDNFLVGTAWVGGFLLTAWLILRPRTVPSAILYSALLLSPSVLFAVSR